MAVSRARRKALSRVFIYVAAIVVAAGILAPPVWLFISSISTQSELLSVPVHWIPHHPTFERYARIIRAASEGGEAEVTFKRSMVNSIIVALFVTALCISIGTLSSYAFARLPIRGKTQLLFMILFIYMLPPIAVVIPLYEIMGRLGLLDTHIVLVLLYSAFLTPFVIWIMRGYFLTIPKDLEEAAMIDGCTRVSALFRVVLPLSVPGLVATSLFCFLMSWEEFFMALIFTSSPAAKTIPVAIAEFSGRHSIDYGMMATGGVLAAIPPVLIALLFQKYIVSGLTSGAVKG
ncbi:MAG: carbohydrate ABC transporter permease [Firmicutes bacterium]|nr:carbohydrate ABC transporter permease [Bacillota bacterium]